MLSDFEWRDFAREGALSNKGIYGIGLHFSPGGVPCEISIAAICGGDE